MEPDLKNLEAALHEHFRLQSFRRGQKEVIQSVLKGRDAVTIMPTGGGKSLCFQLPALLKKGLTLVVSPLISLMRDQVGALERLGIPAGALHSDQEFKDKKEIFARIKKSESFMLYLSPERVQKEGFAQWIQNQKNALFAIDEAHCISQWGHDFREDYGKLSLLRQLCPQVPLLALTATATPQVGSDIAYRLGMRQPDQHVYGFYRPGLFYQVYPCENDAEKMAVLLQALEQTPIGRVIVYCGTRKQTEEIAHVLSKRSLGVGYYHAGLDSEKRQEIQDKYDRGKIRILCATNAFGMGIDHPDVRLVVHYQMPANLESYYQEVGRAGRDGDPSTCLLLYARKDKALQTFFIREAQAPKSVISYRWRALDAIVDYAEGGECRHSGILTYFRDSQRITACGHCDACVPDSDRAIRQVETPVSTKTRRKKKAKEEDIEPFTPEARSRFESIRNWRLEYSRRLDVPAFIVFSDKTLRDLCMKMPQTEAALLDVYGIGKQKAEQFGTELLAALKEL